jgi:hypothetical protein
VGIRVVVEAAPKRAFASALDWPGWSRGAKTADEALERLVEYGPRYAPVAKRAKVGFSVPRDVAALEVVERLTGGSGTDFGVPSAAAAAEDEALKRRELDQLVALLRAAWAEFDAAAQKATGRQLRLGPRGGGRQVPKIVEHVTEAEAAYLHQLGTKVADRAIETVRRELVETLTARVEGRELERPNRVRRPWGPRYAIRRSAWHALDHAWEIEDRASG